MKLHKQNKIILSPATKSEFRRNEDLEGGFRGGKTGQTTVIGYPGNCKCKQNDNVMDVNDIMRVMRFMTLIENVNHLYLLNSNTETVNSPSLLLSLLAFLAVCAPTFTVFATSITGLPQAFLFIYAPMFTVFGLSFLNCHLCCHASYVLPDLKTCIIFY